MSLTNEQWSLLAPLIPIPVKKDGRGRPRKSDRDILDGILWILRTGAPWKDLPDRYPPYQTCHRRFQEWTDRAVFPKILTVLARDMEERGKINLKECFIDGTFSSAKKGGPWLGRLSVERAAKSWQLQILLVFLSPCTWPLLLPMRSDWWKQRLPSDLLERIHAASLGTRPMTPIPWTSGFPDEGS